MPNALKLVFAVLLFALCLPTQSAAPDESAKPVELQKMKANGALGVRARECHPLALTSC